MMIPKDAKYCPNCRKKQGGILKWVIIAIIVIAIINIVSNGGDDEKVKKTGEVSNNTETTKKEERNNVFKVGDIVETEDLKISFLSSEKYNSDNEFIEPKKGCKFWKFEFEFENISETDQSVSSMMDWECYADNSKVDQAWIGDDSGLDAKLSPGRTTRGTIYFEVPKDAKSIELEYNISFWQSDKIIFVGK